MILKEEYSARERDKKVAKFHLNLKPQYFGERNRSCSISAKGDFEKDIVHEFAENALYFGEINFQQLFNKME